MESYENKNIVTNNDKREIKTVLVTGGAGYIGCNVVLNLVKQGHRVVVIDNFSNSYPDGIKNLQKKFPSIKLYAFDMLNSKNLEEVFIKEKIDSVIHLAGKKYVAESFEKEEEYRLSNVVLTANLLKLMKKYNVKQLIFSSSITVYGKTNKTVVDENTVKKPLSPYACQKKECEQIIKKWAKQRDVQAIVLRLSNPIGANTKYMLGDNPKTKQYMGVLPFIINNVQQNIQLRFNGGDHPTKDGSTVRDYVHITDVANAFCCAVNSNLKGFNDFNIGSGAKGYSVLDILRTVEKCLAKTADYCFGPRREGDVSIFISDINKAKQKLNFKVTKNLKNMISTQIEFTQKQNDLYAKK